ncbi:MAG: lipopolysaccharide export LptBFGC system permease protein LptF [Bacteroidia bacterium]|jgi:lipopolysaccharide export LptBFGC system permease protein LptF
MNKKSKKSLLKAVFIRVFSYPFCVLLIVLGIHMMNNPDTEKAAGAGIGAIIIASIYLISDVILIVQRINKKPDEV